MRVYKLAFVLRGYGRGEGESFEICRSAEPNATSSLFAEPDLSVQLCSRLRSDG